jgi:2-polyprenyl-3-methyl-5-hydroxy-6-metoxy-1,4-benzoquinol methylase
MTVVPDLVKDLWARCELGEFSSEQCSELEREALDEYRVVWRQALVPSDRGNLRETLLNELQEYFLIDRSTAVSRCRTATRSLCDTWRNSVDQANPGSIVSFYANHLYIYELMWWHTLEEDSSPLAYVVGLELARCRSGRRYLDFGSGVGSGALLFAKEGFEVTQADVSAQMLAFAQWRVMKHGYKSLPIDLRTQQLPEDAYDFVTAMDVFEHLADPLATVDALAKAIRHGGCLFGRFAGEQDKLRPQHIVRDFAPVFARLRERGFEEVWRDEWLWGHQLFSKTADT